jgi:hypothetical protein
LTAAAVRRRADRLTHEAETIRDREPCRDVAPAQHRLREAAGHADQRAGTAEATTRRRVPRWS